MPQYSTEEIIQGLKEKNKEKLLWINRHHLPQITRMVTANSGTAADAKDLLQNALISLWRKAQNDQLVLYTDFSYFLNMICHRLWMRMLRDRKREQDGELRILFRIYQDLEIALNRSDELEIRNIFNSRKRRKAE
ncbi:MAG TPA: sigma factor [Bacteroidales bacterium]|nr:sigma factor [Bacteroidales bacterium]HRZ50200.1 sigma factor [Bacteroidales bacterium]